MHRPKMEGFWQSIQVQHTEQEKKKNQSVNKEKKIDLFGKRQILHGEQQSLPGMFALAN